MKRNFDGKCAGRHDGLPTIPGTGATMPTHSSPGNGMLPHSTTPNSRMLASALSHTPGNGILTTASTPDNGIMSATSSSGNGVISTCAQSANCVPAPSNTMAGNPMAAAGNNGMASVSAPAAMMGRAGPGNMSTPGARSMSTFGPGSMSTSTSQALEVAGPSVPRPSPEGAQGSGVSSTSATTSPTGETNSAGQQVAKDESYWEKRRKNNESAKRSREARRQKEAAVAYRALQLERENYVLETQLRYLQADVDQLERQALSIAKPNQNKAMMYANNLNAASDFDNCQYDLSSHANYQGPPPPPPPSAGSTA